MTPLEAEADAVVQITKPMFAVDPATITNVSPKKYITAALGAGFEVKAGTTETSERRPTFQSGPNLGEARPDILKSHLWVEGRAKGASFSLHFVNNRFAEGRVWDAAGWPTELWADYKPSAIALKRTKDEPMKMFTIRMQDQERELARRNDEYNDGEFWVNSAPRLVSTGMALDEWMADMIPGFETRKKAVRKKDVQASATAVELIEIGEWVA
jgi:hypothetical protein